LDLSSAEQIGRGDVLFHGLAADGAARASASAAFLSAPSSRCLKKPDDDRAGA